MAAARCTALLLVLLIPLPLTQAAVPGSFFWKPRVGLDLAMPTNVLRTMRKPTPQNVALGLAVVIQGYRVSVTIAALGAISDLLTTYPHLSPLSASYYTNAYRWALRHLSLIPEWLGGDKKYIDTHKVWKQRFFYMDKFLPHWVRPLLFFVDKDEWKQEEAYMKRFVRYAEPAFGKYYMFPSKVFNNFASYKDKESPENLNDVFSDGEGE